MADRCAPVILELDQTLRSLTEQGATAILKTIYAQTTDCKAAFLSKIGQRERRERRERRPVEPWS